MKTGLLERLRRVKICVFDFDGVFTDNSVYIDEEGKETVRCSRSDSFGLRLLDKAGIKYWVLSSEENPVVSHRCLKMKCPVRQGVWDKKPVLEELCREAGAGLNEALYMGNDVNDIPCLLSVGFPVIVQDSHPALEGVGEYRTRACGGQAAVREVCDLLAEAHEVTALDFTNRDEVPGDAKPGAS